MLVQLRRVPLGLPKLVLALAFALHAAVVVAAEPTPGIVHLDRGRVTLHVAAMPLADLLQRLERQSGARIRGTIPERSITADLADVPLQDALDTILGAESFMLTYGGDGSVRAIELLAAGTAAPPPSPASTPSPAPDLTARAPLAEEQRQAAILQRRVTVSRALARAVDEEQPSVGRLLHAALGERRAGLRAEARAAVLAAFARDPETEAAYLSTLRPVDDAVLADMMRARSVDGSAEEWFAAVAARAGSEELREKAAAVLEQLRGARGQPGVR
jgi:hypothetical protein